MTIELAKQVVIFLNTFPPKSVRSKTYSPRTILMCKYLDWKKSCKIHFGDYAQVHKNRNMTNMLEERTQRARNLEETYKLFFATLW